MKYAPNNPILFGETMESLAEKLHAVGEKEFRARQILEWVYKKFETDPDKMTNLPAPTKAWLKDNFILAPSSRQLVKGDPDATQKLLLKMGDGSLIESVLIKAPISDDDEASDGEELTPDNNAAKSGVLRVNGPCGPARQRKTICVSTQVGCAYGCKFCASGMLGWRRDLLAGEIVSEIMEIIKFQKENSARLNAAKSGAPCDMPPAAEQPFENIVVMGMGEPLSNFENLMRALTIVNAPWGLNFGARRITVSTSGVVPKIRELAELPAQFRLAISLHGATNAVRDQIMPVNKKYPLEELIEAARYYNERHNRMLTFEYILIDGLNDTYEQAEALVKLCDGLKVHINCIPYNKVEGLPWKRPSIMRQQAFTKKLRDANISVTVRHEKGNRIEAACGQLRLKEELKGI
jgi:23S rRNA (adenine2503-C2)-methyltransferase